MFELILDPSKITIWRYSDPEMGPRKIPILENQFGEVVRINADAKFAVNFDTNQVSICEKDLVFNVGSKLMYSYDN